MASLKASAWNARTAIGYFFVYVIKGKSPMSLDAHKTSGISTMQVQQHVHRRKEKKDWLQNTPDTKDTTDQTI